MRAMLTMLMFVLIMLIIILCSHETEFYVGGNPCYTETNCINSKQEYKYDYHYGLSYRGKFEFYYGGHYVTICNKYKVDTICTVINPK